MKKLLYTICGVVFILGIGWSSVTFGQTVQAKKGDDPGVSISSPDTISSRQQVELKVTLSASAGKLDKDGQLQVSIPKSTVAQKKDIINNLVIGTPFYLLTPSVTEDTNGNYILNIGYDHNKIDEHEATGETFIIRYQAPMFNIDASNIPDSVNFDVTLSKANKVISTDSDRSEIQKGSSGCPLLAKWSTRPHKDINGVRAAIMSLDNSASNIFAITVNYSQQEISNAVLRDITPKQTTLIDPGNYIPATGDKEPIQHIRIAKVTERDSTGIPSKWKYVTDSFLDKITTNTRGFSIDFGNIAKSDSYIVMYSEKVAEGITPTDFGVEQNTASLESNGQPIRTVKEHLALDNSQYQAVSLTKEVSQATISTTKGNFIYSLKLKAKNGTIPVGTRIIDPLPNYTLFNHTTKYDHSAVSQGVYDRHNNQIVYTLLQPILEGKSQTVEFQADYSNPKAQQGDKVINRAYITYEGTNIYSNDATTTLEGSAILQKIDVSTNKPLAGATFKIVNQKGEVVKTNLHSNKKGIVKSGLLPPGDYQYIETKAPMGYVIDPTPVLFKVIPGEVNPINLTKTNTVATRVSGTKTWQDQNNKAEKRPKAITINLYQNGRYIQSKQITEKDHWKYKFIQLPKYDSKGKRYKYTVKEETVKNYKTIQDGFDFTNRYTPEHSSNKPNSKNIPNEPKRSKVKNQSGHYLPKTGDSLVKFTNILGVVFIALGLYLTRKKIIKSKFNR